MRTINIFLTIFCWLAINADLSANEENLDSIKTLYDKGDFQQAELALKQLIDQQEGEISAGLHYNMGNVLLKQNKIGEAIYHYESAFRLAPFDEDIQYNLSLAQKKVVDEFEVVPQFSTYPFFIRVNYWVDVFWLGILGFVLILSGLILVVKAKMLDKIKVPVYWRWLVLGGLLLVFWARTQSEVIRNHVKAIVVENAVDIQAEPNELSKALFVLNEGVVLQVLKEEEGGTWLNVKIPNGAEGWVQFEKVKTIR